MGVTLGDEEHGSVELADVRWGAVNMAVVDWGQVTRLGDERTARNWKLDVDDAAEEKQQPHAEARAKERAGREGAFAEAVRANRQLATALRGQGLTEQVDSYAYRAQVLQRRVLRLQGKWPQALGSWVLDRVAGHGYKPGRTLVAYLATIVGFAILLLLAGNGLLTFGLPPSQYHTLPWYEALILSISSFHGRGFLQPLNSPGDPVAILAALEAVFGLFIEVSFIATFTQRFFAR